MKLARGTRHIRTRAEMSFRGRFLAALLITVVFNVIVLTHFHDRFWWPPDEGVYAHTAERMLHGEVLNADVEEIHTGYIHFLHVAAFRAFGVEMVSLRYPLVAAGFFQSCLVFLIFARHDLFVAMMAAMSATAMGVIQFLSPQPSWYCLLFATVIAFCLTFGRRGPWHHVSLGFLVGLVFFFRQITGVFVALGVLTYLLTEERKEVPRRETLLARGLLALMLSGTIAYLASGTNLSGLLLIGLWPLALLVQAVFVATTTNREAVAIVLRLGLGFVTAALPILAYHLAHGSLRSFVDDTFVRAFDIQGLPYLKLPSYTAQQSYALGGLIQLETFAAAVNGVFWLLLPASMWIVGALTFQAFARSRSSGAVGVLPILAVFYALVALFQQIPVYLFYALPLTVAALLWLNLERSRQVLSTVGFAAILFSTTAIYYHAGQPASRQLSGIIRGRRIPLVPAVGLERTGLWMDRETLDVYTELVRLIKSNSQADDTLFAMPYDPELYFLTERRNPFRFWNTAVGIRSDEDKQEVLRLLAAAPPRIVVVAPEDRNNTPSSNELIAHVRANYALIRTIGPFEVYRAP